MKDFSVSMALVDYIPVILFLLAAVILIRDLRSRLSGGMFAILSAGFINIVCAGGLKATYKLLYALNICDFEALSNMFFPVQSIGFLLAGIGMISLLLGKKDCVCAVAPPVFSGTFVFVGLMVAGLGLMDIALCVLSVRLKKKALIILFVLSFVCSLGMGYLSSQDFAEASMNWIAEIINIVGQGSLFGGVYLLHRNGLADPMLTGEVKKK